MSQTVTNKRRRPSFHRSPVDTFPLWACPADQDPPLRPRALWTGPASCLPLPLCLCMRWLNNNIRSCSFALSIPSILSSTRPVSRISGPPDVRGSVGRPRSISYSPAHRTAITHLVTLLAAKRGMSMRRSKSSSRSHLCAGDPYALR